jgi:hypothetical protein
MGTIQKADPAARRKAIWVICVASILGVSAILAFQSLQEDFQAWLASNIDFLLENPIVVFVVSLVFVSPVLAVGVYLFLFGNRTARAQRFPPPGYTVVRDTVVLEGPKGRKRGRVIQILSLFSLCMAGAIPFVMWYVFRSLASAS